MGNKLPQAKKGLKMTTISKSDQVRTHLAAGQLKEALALAKGFRLGLTKAQSNAIKTGYECMVHPAFYIQLKVDIPAAIEAGEKALRELVAQS